MSKARGSHISSACDADGPREIRTSLARLKEAEQCDAGLSEACILTNRASDYPVQHKLLLLQPEPELKPEPVRCILPDVVRTCTGAVLCKWVSLDAQSSRTLADGISPMPPGPANQSRQMQRNSIIAQDLSSITFPNIRLRRALRPAESETGFTALLDGSHGHCRILIARTNRRSALSRKENGTPRDSPPGLAAEAVSFHRVFL